MSEESRRTFSLTIHPWCMSPARDEAVRAAEDGRSAPLPTLDEAIAAVTERRPPEPGGGANVTGGLRTERITLEITHDLDAPLGDWIVQVLDESLGFDESVRVVEEAKLAPAANADAESNHAPAASGAAGTEVAEIARLSFDAGWGSSRDGFNAECAFDHLAPKGSTFEGKGGEPYEKLKRDSVAKIMSEAAPQPAKGWLDEVEREALEAARDYFDNDDHGDSECVFIARVLKQILASSSPPEVVLPLCAGWADTVSRSQVKAALAAAGVPVKEVGRE